MTIKYLHTMVRVNSIEDSLHFYCTLLGLQEVRRKEYEAGKFTLIFLAPPGQADAMLELTYNWDSTEEYSEGRNFGHLAYEVEDIYEITQKLMDSGITINRPPRDGRMAFIKSPDGISIEILQEDGELPIQEPWKTMQNSGSW